MKESHTLPQVLPIVIRGHIIDVNLVTFLGNERKADMHEVDTLQPSDVLCIDRFTRHRASGNDDESESEVLKKREQATATQDVQAPLTPEGKI